MNTLSTLQIIGGVASGVLIFIIGQAFLRFVMEPIQEFHKLRGEISSALIYYANVLINERPLEKQAADGAEAYRQFASRLMALIAGIPCYKVWSWLRIVPQYKSVVQASRELIGLSNYIYVGKTETGEGSHSSRRRIVASLLNLTLGE
jgi:hypothetical protein